MFCLSSFNQRLKIFPSGNNLLYVFSFGAGPVNTTWDSRTSAEDMEEMWNHPSVSKEWSKSGEKRGHVRFSHDTEKKPYLSRVELRVRMHG